MECQAIRMPVNTMSVVLQMHSLAMETMVRCVLEAVDGVVVYPLKSKGNRFLPMGDGILISEHISRTDRPLATRHSEAALCRWPRLLVGGMLGSDEEADFLSDGIAGYLTLPKQLPFLPKAVIEVAAGGLWFSRNALVHALRAVDSEVLPGVPQTRQGEIAKLLTRREHMIVQSVCSGLRNKDIADRLFISEKTVKLHLSRIYQKLSITGRAELMIMGLRDTRSAGVTAGAGAGT